MKTLYRHDAEEIWDPAIAPLICNQYHNQLDVYLFLANQKGYLDVPGVGYEQVTLSGRLDREVVSLKEDADIAMLYCGVRFVEPGREEFYEALLPEKPAVGKLQRLAFII